ncbi:uncharacterized protein LOC119021272 [Acanthopagrus latus]|uniref:uncharacterized protein LOC119021272 n=1 Tax=Acanthopagrus latus TaxID=8177 RepID=UPI00187CCDD0|nr:uncharacterized protein LOC119021272 [Acanthopagrus latus]
MKMKLVHALLVVAVMSAPVNAEFKTTSWTTPGPQGMNLKGKMFTLSQYEGGISFYPPYFSPTPSTTYYITTDIPTSTSYPWTTAPTTRSVSVCLRYLIDFGQTSNPRIFTLSPSSTPLLVNVDQLGVYTLNFNQYSYNTLYMKPSIRFWSTIGPDIWSRFCFTLDSTKNVAQVFSGSNISIRKLIRYQYVWSGEPVIQFEGFDGQVTDVQMWDYPLSYREVFKYMTNGVYGPYRGSVLTWSSINYTPSGNTLLEDVYEWQAKQQISGRRRGRQPKGGRKNRKFVNAEREKKQL